MSEPFIGEIKMFAGNFAPRSWALCDGQLLSISQNEALFSLFGTTYGGDGRTSFGLPDMRGRIPVHSGNGSAGPGLTPRPLGQKAGAETSSVNTNQLPAHRHNLIASNNFGDADFALNNVPAWSNPQASYTAEAPTVPMASNTSSSTGSNQPHTNVMPFQCINYIVALFGVYPSRN